jgi:hypothetical protein
MDGEQRIHQVEEEYRRRRRERRQGNVGAVTSPPPPRRPWINLGMTITMMRRYPSSPVCLRRNDDSGKTTSRWPRGTRTRRVFVDFFFFEATSLWTCAIGVHYWRARPAGIPFGDRRLSIPSSFLFFSPSTTWVGCSADHQIILVRSSPLHYRTCKPCILHSSSLNISC